MRVLSCLLSALVLLSLPIVANAAARPDILLITLDTTRADHMGFLGSSRGLTPNLDKLAQQSVVFTHTYAHVPLTPPSHATILTGTYPQFNHLTYMGVPLSKDLPYLPELLLHRGYSTAAFVGSSILDPKNPTGAGFDRGFQRFEAGFRKRKQGEDRYQTVERRAQDVVNRALTWLNRQKSGTPVFMWVHCYDPHGPYDPPEPYKSRYTEAYDGEIAYTDSAMGKLLSGLRAAGRYENTIIAVMADHGEAFGEHGERHHGIFLYDETIHVPLVIKLPNERSAGSRVSAKARLVDVSPTILQIAGVAIPSTMQGQSLISAPAANFPDRPVYSESVYGQRAFGWSVLRSWRSGKYLYVEAPNRELYEQTTDVEAEHNVAPQAPAVTSTMESALKTFLSKTSRAGETTASLTPEQEENLRALGYLPGNAAQGGGNGKTGPDPKGRIEVANLFGQTLFDMDEGRFQDAVPRLKKVLELEPNTGMAYLELGKAYRRLKQPEQGLPYLTEAVERVPQDGEGHYELGRTLIDLKHWDEALPQFQEAVKFTPKSPDLHFYLGVVYERAHRLPEAMQEFRRTIELDPDHFRANVMLGRLLGMQKKGNEALPYLHMAAKIQPNSIEVHQFLANVYHELGQQQIAQKELAEANRLREHGGVSLVNAESDTSR
jgi:arylsulfatase A-like enzyme/tetratricopeptide (TPR) repeat protein